MDQHKKKILQRLKIAGGQVKGLEDMIEKDVYCIDVITQISAVKSALSSVEDALMENHLKTCALHHIKHGKERDAMDEILKVYRLKK
jgi:DNA-binding FrmR family transcriptional regulator